VRMAEYVAPELGVVLSKAWTEGRDARGGHGLCTNKSGILTKNAMRVMHFYVDGPGDGIVQGASTESRNV
jgi:hypothetical protein